MNKIKLIAIDLDDTLLDNNKKISIENKIAITEAVKQGVKIVIASGRSEFGIKPILKELNLLNTDTYFIAYNGTRIYSLKDDKLIYSKTLDGKDIKDIVKTLPSNLWAHFYNDKIDLFATGKNPYTDYAAGINYRSYEIVDVNQFDDNDHFIKLLFTGDPKNIEEYKKVIPEEFKTRFSLTVSNPIFLEFLAKGVSKGSALKWLGEQLNFEKENIAAIGDNDNDLEMLEEAGYAVAMANSLSKKVLDVANIITTSNEENGVANFINKYVLEK